MFSIRGLRTNKKIRFCVVYSACNRNTNSCFNSNIARAFSEIRSLRLFFYSSSEKKIILR